MKKRQTAKPGESWLTFSLANRQMFTIKLQIRRLRSAEPEDSEFVFRGQADLEFLVISLHRLRTIASMVGYDAGVEAAIQAFDAALPFLTDWRDIVMHIDDYATGAGRKKDYTADALQFSVGDWATEYEWMGKRINVDDAYKTARALFEALRGKRDRDGHKWPSSP